MRKILAFLISFLFFVFSLTFSGRAFYPQDVIINEIAWMGTEISYNHEWIELYNNTNETINLDGWVLKASDGTPNITLAGSLPANGFFILERTDDDTLPEILANKIYRGSLENSGEHLKLYDNLGNLIDSVDCSDGWFAGDNENKQTMERKNPSSSGSDPDNWQTSQNPGGTPESRNLTRDSPSGTVPQTFPESKPKLFPSNIFINEVLPSPEGPDAEEEWTEIFNKNDFEVDISEWKIEDTIGSTKQYTFPEGTKISNKGFLVLPRPISKITLNNDGDGLKLIQPDGNIIDTVTYEKAPLGQSYNHTESGWIWSNILTPGSQNIEPGLISVKKEGEEAQESLDEKGLAAIGESFQKIQQKQLPKSFSLFLIALGTAIFSAVIILILKKKLTVKSGDDKIDFFSD